MNELTSLDPHDLYQAPHQMAATVHRIEAVIAAAAALQRWDDLEKAVDFLIDCQQVIVRWWDDHVQPAGQGKIVANQTTILSATAAAERIGSDKTRVSRWRTALKNLDAYRDKVTAAARAKAELEAAENHRAEGTGDNEWFTPERYIIAAREVMGSIDLDPATHAEAQKIVQATRFFTREDNGLKQDWAGRVWMNPPYTQPLIGQFINKLVEELAASRVVEAIALTHNYTDTAWFHAAVNGGAMMCFTLGRIKFVDIAGDVCAPTQGQCFFYFGDRRARFREVFGQFGFVR